MLISVRRVSRDELLGDSAFIAVSAIISFLVVFLFDIHHSFYSWPIKIQFIFNNPLPYFLFIPLGVIIGFLLIKLLLYGVKKEI